MLNKDLVIQKMKERGFVVYASMGNSVIQFVSKHMYETSYEDKVSLKERIPIINIIVDLEKDEFRCIYNLSKSIDTLNSPSLGSVMNDNHFDKLVLKFESEAKWMSILAR